MEYIRDFFYLSNGQLNWVAINTIVDGVLLLTLVGITWWYASQVKKQTNLMNKANERKIVLDCIQEFLTPSSKELENEIWRIKDNNFKFVENFVENIGISKIAWINKFSDMNIGLGFAKNDVFRKYPDLENLFSDHDELLDELIEIYEKIKETLENTIQIDCLKDLVEQFNRNQKEEKVDELKGDALDNPLKYFINYLISYKHYKKHGSDGIYTIKFLKEFEVKIFNCINTDWNELHEPEENKLNQLVKKDSEILDNIIQIINDYRQEYCISENEIAPSSNMNHIIH